MVHFSSDDSIALPAGLAELPAVQRRQSVFYDLLTVFRKSTVTSSNLPNGAFLNVPGPEGEAGTSSTSSVDASRMYEFICFGGSESWNSNSVFHAFKLTVRDI